MGREELEAELSKRPTGRAGLEQDITSTENDYLARLSAQTGVPRADLEARIDSAKHRPMAMALGAAEPRNWVERVMQTAASIPLIAAGGGTAGGVTQTARTLGTVGGLSRARGETWPQTAIDVAGAGVGLGGTALAGKVAGAASAPAVRETARVAEAARVGKAAGQVIPEIQAETDKELWGAAQKWGTGKIEGAFNTAVDAIKKRLGHAIRFDVPSIGKDRVTLEQAVRAYRDAPPEAKAGLRDEIMGALGRVDQMAPKLFEEALQARAAAYTYVGTLQKSLDPSGKFDPRRLMAYVNKEYRNLQTYAGKYWPKLEEALLGLGKQAPQEIPPKPTAARVFGKTVEGMMPASWSKVAESAAPALTSPATRATTAAVTGQPPLSAVSAALPYYALRPALRRIPGGRELAQDIEEAAGE